MISVIVPTIKGREHWLERCLDSYAATTRDYELIVVPDFPTCNSAWNDGIKRSVGDVIHLSADDLEPHPGWQEAGMEYIDKGYLPCPRVLNTDGTIQSCGSTAEETLTGTSSDVARVPFFPREILHAVYPIMPGHYMGDYWVTAQARKVGWPTVVVRSMVFTHHLAPEGRKETLARDMQTYRRKTR